MTVSIIISIIVPVLYVSAAIALMPAISRERYRALREIKSKTWYSDDEVRGMAVWSAFGFSLIWPIFVFILIGRYSLDRDQRVLAKQKEQEKALELAERQLSLKRAAIEFKKDHEETQWLQQFNEFDRNASKS